VFERLFGASDSTDTKARLAAMRRDKSVLDSVADKLGSLQGSLGGADRLKMDQYLDSVRDIERRIQKAEDQSDLELPVLEAPAGVPQTFEEHSRLMFELLALAYQVDMTRVGTFLLAREASVRAYPEIGISEPHHPLSHHGNSAEKLDQLAKLNTFHAKMFAEFVAKLASTSDGDGSLLDHTVLMYGAGLSDSNIHIPLNVPTIVIAGTKTSIKGGRHLTFDKGTPLTNFQLTLLDKMNVNVEHLGDSTGELNLLSEL
jgi:hypothetical protein